MLPAPPFHLLEPYDAVEEIGRGGHAHRSRDWRGTVVRRWRLLLRTLAIPVLVGIGCNGLTWDFFVGKNPPYLIILPRVVQVRASPTGSPRSFRLTVVSEDAIGAPLDPGTLTWSASTATPSIAASGSEALVTLPGGLTPGDAFQLTATNGTLTATALVVVVDAAVTPSDEATAPYVANDLPAVAMVSGPFAGTCDFDRIASFVSSAPLEALSGGSGCGRAEASIFTESTRPVLRQPMSWSAGQDMVSAVDAGPPVQIPLQVVLGVATAYQPAAMTFVDAGVLAAEANLRKARAGIVFPPTLQTTIRQALPEASFNQCAHIPNLPPNVAPHPQKLNLYFIESIDGVHRGYFCEPNVILISRNWALPTTIPHEFGHALGLMAPDFGHTDNVHGFAIDNLMFVAAGSGTGLDARERLTLGQVYRMHVDGRSWIKRNADLSQGPVLCPCDPYATAMCPALSTDPRPVLRPPPTPMPNLCPP